MESIWRDLRFGIRHLARSPLYTIVAILALGVGVGANITVFGFISALLFRPLDVQNPDRLVRVFGEGGNTAAAMATFSDAYLPVQDYFEYRNRNQSFSHLAAQFIGGPAAVRMNGPAEMIPVMQVSANYFETIGVPAAMGRVLQSGDGRFGAREVVVLSDSGWRRFFGADPEIVGKTVFIDGIPRTIVGVMPDWFKGTNAPMVPQIYSPIVERHLPAPIRVWMLGRLKPGVTAEQAHADLMRVAGQLQTEDRRRRSLEVYPALTLMPMLTNTMSLASAVFAVIVGVVLLIVCDNIAIFVLLRAAARRGEIAIRLALGISRFRLLQAMLIETLVLCVSGGLVGLFAAYATSGSLTRIYSATPMPFALTFVLDWRVAVFTIVVSAAATLLCGLMPALQSLRTDVVSGLHQSGISDPARVRSGLVVTQLTLSTALVVTAVVLANSAHSRQLEDRGFVSDGVLMSTLTLGRLDYDPERRAAFLETLMTRFQQGPGVSSLTVVDSVPLANNSPLIPSEIRSEGRMERAYTNRVSPGFFATLGIPLLVGRDFAASDNFRSRSVAIVNETLAAKLWPGGNPVGQVITINDGPVEVIGIARNSRYESIDEAPKPLLYRPMGQSPVLLPTFLIKSSSDPVVVFAFIRRQVAEVDPDLVPYNLSTLDERLQLGLTVNRTAATVAGGLGILAFLLGAMGIFGTMSFLVQKQRREIGIRMALGLSLSGVIRTISRQGLIWIGAGIGTGLAASLAVTFLLRNILFGIRVADPAAFLLTPLLLGATAYVACYIPARKASRLDILKILRDE
jgi:predicted permease